MGSAVGQQHIGDAEVVLVVFVPDIAVVAVVVVVIFVFIAVSVVQVAALAIVGAMQFGPAGRQHQRRRQAGVEASLGVVVGVVARA